MADMTNEEFKKLAEDIKNNTSKVDIDTVLYNFSQTDNLSGYDADSLSKLEELLNNNLARTTPMMRDAINAKIAEQRKVIAQQQAENQSTEEKFATPEKESHNQEQPSEKAPQQEETKPNSYNLAKEYNALKTTIEADSDNPENDKLKKRMKEIEDYARQELTETALSTQNAPMVQDYVQILSAADKDFKYEHAAELEQKLAEYDKASGLDGDLPSAEKANENMQKWFELTKDVEPEKITQIPALDTLKVIDKDLAQDLTEILKTSVITQLALEEPSADSKTAMTRYQEVMTAVSAQYMENLRQNAKMYPQSEEEDYLRKKFLTDFNITPEQFDEILKDEQKKKQFTEDFDKYAEAQRKLYNQNVDEYLKQNNLTRADWDKADKDSSIRKGFQKYCVTEPIKALNAVYTNGNTVYASRLAQKTNMSQAPEAATQLQQKMEQKHSKLMGIAGAFLKNGAKTLAVGALLGPVGLTVKQGWELYGDLKKSWKNFEEQSNSKASKFNIKNWKNFSNYLKENPDERKNLQQKTATFAVSLGATVATVSMVGLTGGLGLVGGAAAGLTGATVTNAASATFGGVAVTKVKGVLNGLVATGFGASRYIDARKEARPLENELLSILRKQEGLSDTPEKKGFFARFTTNDPAKQTLKNLTALFKNDDVKMVEKVDALSLSTQDKMRVMELATQLKALKSKSLMAGTSAALGAGGGLFIAEGGAEKVREVFGSFIDGHSASGNGGQSNWDLNKSFADNMKANQWHPQFGEQEQQPEIKVPYAPGMQPTDGTELTGGSTATLPADSFEKGGDMWYATQMGPTVMEEKLRAMGFNAEMDKLPRASHGAIPSRVMADYLKTAQMSPEQAKELQDFVSNRQSFNAEVARINARDGYNPHTHTGGAHTHNSNGGNGNAAVKPVDLSQVQGARLTQDPTQASINPQIQQIEAVQGKTESGSWLKRIFSKKHENSFVMPAGLDANAQAEQYAGMKAMADYNAKHPDAPITSPEEMKQHGYNVKGTVNGHKIHVKISDNGHTETRTVDGVRTKIRTFEGDQSQTHVVTYKNNTTSANTVGNTNGTKDDKVLGVIQNNTGRVTYIQDGDSKNVYEVKNQNGQTTTTESTHSARQVKSLLKNYGSTWNNGRD